MATAVGDWVVVTGFDRRRVLRPVPCGHGTNRVRLDVAFETRHQMQGHVDQDKAGRYEQVADTRSATSQLVTQCSHKSIHTCHSLRGRVAGHASEGLPSRSTGWRTIYESC